MTDEHLMYNFFSITHYWNTQIRKLDCLYGHQDHYLYC